MIYDVNDSIHQEAYHKAREAAGLPSFRTLAKYCPQVPTPQQEKFLSLSCEEALYAGEAGSAKIVRRGEVIMTPSGWKKIEDIRVGSRVSHPDGHSQQVVQLHPWVRQKGVKVTFHDGTSTTVMWGHLWQAWRSGKARKRPRGQLLNGQESAQVIETRTLKQWLDTAIDQQKRGKRPFWPLIPVCQPIEFCRSRKTKFKIKPYELGVWLGDGFASKHKRSNTWKIGITSADHAHFNREFWLEDTRRDGKYNYAFRGECAKTWKDALQHLKLLGTKSDTKFIPPCYLWSTVENRWAILQGLMDTDGTVCEHGNLSFTTTSKQLSDGVTFLVQSLGGTATVSESIPHYIDSNGEKHYGKKCYTLYIKLRDERKCFRLQRKIDRCQHHPGPMYRRVVSIEEVEEIEGRCITVSEPNGLYLTNDFIVTHNSSCLGMAALMYADVPGYRALMLRVHVRDFFTDSGLGERMRGWLHDKPVHWNSDEKVFTFLESGATIRFGHIRTPHIDLMRIRSREYSCMARGQRVIMANGSRKPIEELLPGDVVDTLLGPRPVTRIYPSRYADCCKLLSKTGECVVPWTHTLLTSEGWQSCLDVKHTTAGRALGIFALPTHGRYRSFSQGLDTESTARSLPQVRSLSLPHQLSYEAISAYLANDRIDDVLSYASPPTALRPPLSCDQPKPQSLARLRAESAAMGGTLTYARSDPSALDSASYYSAYHHLRDARSHPHLDTFRAFLQAPTDVDEHIRSYCNSDGQARIPKRTHVGQLLFSHPYSSAPMSSTCEVAYRPFSIQDAGSLEVFDIEVEEANHYISSNSMVQRNCICWEELTEFNLPDDPDMTNSYKFLNRSLRQPLGFPVPPRMRATTNPGGPSHRFVKNHFLTDEFIREINETRTRKIFWRTPDRAYVHGYAEDNKYINVEAYHKRLDKLSAVERRRQKFGDWSVKEHSKIQGAWFRYYKREGNTFHLLDMARQNVLQSFDLDECFVFVTVDSAGTSQEEAAKRKGNRSSYSAVGVWLKPPARIGKALICLHVLRKRLSIPELRNALIDVNREFMPSRILVENEKFGKSLTQLLRNQIPIKEVSTGGNDKAARAVPLIDALERGQVYYPHAEPNWLRPYIDELTTWTGLKTDVSDQLDMSAYAGQEVFQAVPPLWDPRYFGVDYRYQLLPNNVNRLGIGISPACTANNGVSAIVGVARANGVLYVDGIVDTLSPEGALDSIGRVQALFPGIPTYCVYSDREFRKLANSKLPSMRKHGFTADLRNKSIPDDIEGVEQWLDVGIREGVLRYSLSDGGNAIVSRISTYPESTDHSAMRALYLGARALDAKGSY